MKDFFIVLALLSLGIQLVVFLFSMASMTENNYINRPDYCHPLNRDIETVPELIIRTTYAPPMLLACLITYPINWRKE